MTDIPRLSNKEYLVMELLVSGEMYGLEMVKESEGKLKRGTIYVTLNRMAEKGYLEFRVEEETTHSGIRRRLYRATAYGTQVYNVFVSLKAAKALKPVII